MNAKVVLKIGRAAGFLGLVMALTGCAHYQYSLLQPGNAPQVAGKQPLRVDYPPLLYQMAERSDRLAIQINNSTDTQVTLLGNRSYIVTPRGETRPVAGAVIAPHSFIGIVLPPAPIVYRAYPSFAWGLGFGYPFYWGPGYADWGIYGAPGYYGPTDYYVSPANNWEWKEGNVRMLLHYQQTTNTFDHQFLFNRAEVKK